MSNIVGLNSRIRVVAFAAALTVAVSVARWRQQPPAESRSRKTSRRYFSEAARTVIGLTVPGPWR